MRSTSKSAGTIVDASSTNVFNGLALSYSSAVRTKADRHALAESYQEVS